MSDFAILDTTEETAEDITEEPATEGEAFNGVALGVFPGVACRSRMLMSMARSLVAASKMEMTPILLLGVISLAMMLEQEKRERKK